MEAERKEAEREREDGQLRRASSSALDGRVSSEIPQPQGLALASSPETRARTYAPTPVRM